MSGTTRGIAQLMLSDIGVNPGLPRNMSKTLGGD